MKKLILAACALTCAASVFAQGTVVFNNRVAGTLVTHVYSGTAQLSGNGATDTPPGTQDWTGYTALQGATWSAQLWSGAAGSTDDANFQAALPITNFRTGAAAGFVNPVTATLANIAADAASAVLQMRVWDNSGGAATYDAATTKGKSALFTVSAIGGQANPAPNLTGLASFSVAGGAVVPEPSSFALVGLGAAALLIFRRRK